MEEADLEDHGVPMRIEPLLCIWSGLLKNMKLTQKNFLNVFMKLGNMENRPVKKLWLGAAKR